MRVLLVEDDELLGDGICVGLEQSGFTVDWVQDGITAESAILDPTLNILILDIALPGQDGLTLLSKLRESGSDIPVLMLTARDTLSDRVLGLDTGADDYLVKPFDLDELCARLRAISRRRSGRSQPILANGDLELNQASRTVTYNKRQVICTSKEFAILEALVLNSGHVLSRQRLEEALYGWGDGVESNSVEVYIHHLRKKIHKEIIKTMRGVGYMIPKQGVK